MVSVTALSIVGLAALVAPGFISVLLATTIGVVEREPSRFKILVASLISSLLIDTVFLGVYQVLYEPVSGLSQLELIFFTPQFRIDLVVIYLGIAILLGGVYSLELIYEVRSKVQHVLWSRSEYQRHRRQPWEGAMDKATVVRVKTPSNARIIGRVIEYSRAEKPHELWLDEIYWVNEETDKPIPSKVTESIVLLEGDIERVTVLDSERSTGRESEDDPAQDVTAEIDSHQERTDTYHAPSGDVAEERARSECEAFGVDSVEAVEVERVDD